VTPPKPRGVAFVSLVGNFFTHTHTHTHARARAVLLPYNFISLQISGRANGSSFFLLLLFFVFFFFYRRARETEHGHGGGEGGTRKLPFISRTAPGLGRALVFPRVHREYCMTWTMSHTFFAVARFPCKVNIYKPPRHTFFRARRDIVIKKLCIIRAITARGCNFFVRRNAIITAVPCRDNNPPPPSNVIRTTRLQIQHCSYKSYLDRVERHLQ